MVVDKVLHLPLTPVRLRLELLPTFQATGAVGSHVERARHPRGSPMPKFLRVVLLGLAEGVEHLDDVLVDDTGDLDQEAALTPEVRSVPTVRPSPSSANVGTGLCPVQGAQLDLAQLPEGVVWWRSMTSSKVTFSS